MFGYQLSGQTTFVESLSFVKDRCSDPGRQNILAEFSEESSLTLYREINFSWDKKLYTEWCSGKGRSGIAWLLAAVRQLRGVRRNTRKGRCPLCLCEEDAKHVTGFLGN